MLFSSSKNILSIYLYFILNSIHMIIFETRDCASTHYPITISSIQQQDQL